MADQLRYPIRKRQHKNEKKPAAKRQKRNDCDKPNNSDQLSPMPAQPIYYLDDTFPLEILMQIAQGFSVQELFEFGKTSPEFGATVEEIYGKRYNGLRVILQLHTRFERVQNEPGYPVVSTPYRLDVYGLETCIWYLKLFGKKIIEILVDYTTLNSAEVWRFNQLLAKHCAHTLETITFREITESSLRPIFDTQPFVNVSRVSFKSSNLNGHLRSVSKCFPNVRCLTLGDTTESCITVNFPNLEELTIGDESGSGISTLLKSKMPILNANPNVSTLIFRLPRMNVALSTILSAIPKNASITELKVHKSLNMTKTKPTATPRNIIENFIRERGPLAKLDVSFHHFKVDDAIYLLTNSNLQEFKYSPVRPSDKVSLMQILPLLNGRGTWTDMPTYGGVIHLKLSNENQKN